MDAEKFQIVAEKLLNELPLHFRQVMVNVVVVIDDFARPNTLAALEISDPYQLLGLYEGSPIGERSISDSGMLPDLIHLYRLPILAMQKTSGKSVEASIYEVLIHEIGHHFGFSDAQMEAIEMDSEFQA